MVAIETMCCNFRFVVIYVVVGFIFDEHLASYISIYLVTLGLK